MKHTRSLASGWTGPLNGFQVSSREGQRVVAEVTHEFAPGSKSFGSERAVADAYLIAAAPELLEWCNRLLLAHKTSGIATNGNAVLCTSFVSGLEYITAKAEGRDS